ncbi:MAG TPA: LemA family protein [Candidatus Hydrogenedentes bacterium]|jgi:LemA protein|nr:MAG: LemA family protein [Candidatus Hydrogenedentes bacterium ADurb.Bin170]HNZ47770.1 LemA family protein [Candidatus Hydrogenedentota bacterium]HOD95797.1 LemA family protein [Candidatus Hydrogenedentota bacterium]HOH42893.1 LemA family protein [Candidatus Hydrogenedentota bacterium]HOM49488.1 LemA family protein [Candidatus Hydrogenedentota bacterium]
MTGTIILIAAGAVLLIFVWWMIAIFNGLVRLRNAVKNAWAQIDVQLKRRHDLIPNLVETAKGYMKHERETLESVIKARNQAAEASKNSAGASAQGALESGLSGALRNFMVVVERYPDLKADTLFSNLQEELASTENRISFARQAYNDAVMMMNNKVEMFPGNIVAGMFNFSKESFFEIEVEAERAVPEVSFS